MKLFMWIVFGPKEYAIWPKKDYYLTEFMVNIWSLHWEYQLQINLFVQRLRTNFVLGILWWFIYSSELSLNTEWDKFQDLERSSKICYWLYGFWFGIENEMIHFHFRNL